MGANNNVALLSLMAKIDQKSIIKAASEYGKTAEEALSDVSSNMSEKFGKELTENFEEALKIATGKLKGVNLSSYTESILSSLFSEKELKEKEKDLETFVKNITNLSKSLSGINPNSLKSMNTRQLDAIIAKQEKILEKDQEIVNTRKRLEDSANTSGRKKSTPQAISKKYLSSDYEKNSENLKKLFATQKDFTKDQEKSIDYLAKMLSLYSDMEKVQPEKGTTKAIQHSQELLTIVQEINKQKAKVDEFTNGAASKFVSDNFTSISKVDAHSVNREKQTFIEEGLKTLNAQKTKLQKDLTTYILNTVKDNFQKMSNETEKVVEQAEKKTDNLQKKINQIKGTGSSEKPIVDNIVNKSQLDLIDDISEKLYDLQEKYSNPDEPLSDKTLKEYISLYKQYEEIIGASKDLSIDPELKQMYDDILFADKAMKEYADSIHTVNTEQEKFKEQTEAVTTTKESTSGKGNSSNQYENLESDLNEIKNAIGDVNNKLDSIDNSEAIGKLETQLSDLDEKVLSVSGSVDKLTESISLLSSLSLTDLQKTVIPLYNGINDVFKQKNGNRISGYWDEVKTAVEGSNSELRELLKNIGLFDSKSNSLKLISDGMENSGGIIGEDKVLIARKNHGIKYEEKTELKKKLDEAYEAGINVSRILDVIGSKESDVFFDIQEKAQGNILGNIYGQGDNFVNTDWLQATDEQVNKFISDLIKLQEMGINVESNLTNIMYDKNKGFSFIDMDLYTTNFDNNVELIQEHMMRIFGDLEDFYLEKNDSINAKLVAKVRERFENLSEQVQQAYAQAQDSHSPSKDFEKLEKDAVDGVVVGANENEEKLKNVGKQMAENIKEGFKEEIKELSTDSKDETNISSGTGNVFQGDTVDNSKEQLAIDKQITNEIEAQTKAQQRKWQEFQKEDEVYQKAQKEAEFIKQNKAAYEELTEAIRQYSEVSKRVSSGKAEDGDIEKMTQLEEKISQLQKQPILSDSQVAKSESALVSLYNQLDKIEQKLQETNQKQVDSGFGKLSTYQGKLDKYNTTIARFNDGGWASSTYLENVQAVEKAVKQYETLLEQIKAKGGIASEEDIQNLKEYESRIKETISTVTNMSASEKGYNFVSAQKELDKIHKLLNENSRMSSDVKAKIRAYYREIESGNPSMSLDRIHGEIMKIYNAEVEAGRAGRSFLDTLKNSGFHQLAAQMAGMFSFYDVVNAVKQAASTVVDLNTQITELSKVSEATSSQIYDDFSSYADIAEKVGGTISDTISATADWSRNGYNLSESKELAEVALLYKNVGDGIDIDTANESLISTLRGFKLEAEDALDIINVFNEVSNNEPIDSAGIGEALQRSAASFYAANTTLQESVALISATNSVVQDPEKVGKQIIAYLYSNVMKIKVAILVKILRRTRPRKDYNICFNY